MCLPDLNIRLISERSMFLSHRNQSHDLDCKSLYSCYMAKRLVVNVNLFLHNIEKTAKHTLTIFGHFSTFCMKRLKTNTTFTGHSRTWNNWQINLLGCLFFLFTILKELFKCMSEHSFILIPEKDNKNRVFPGHLFENQFHKCIK